MFWTAYRSFTRRMCNRTMNTYAERKKINPYYKNPCEELQQYIEIPLFRENEFPFTPSIQDMKAAQKLFVPSKEHEISFLTAAVKPSQFPEHDLPEVTFIGRSNVGKSSLLRAVFSKAPDLIVRTSKKPGNTRTVNFFEVGKKLCLVDMPGYGFRQPKCFVTGVEGYLKTRKNLHRTFLLVDGKIGFQGWDEIAVDMLEEFKIPYGLIITKIDSAIPSQRLKNLLFLQQIRDKYMSISCFPQPFMISSITGEGIAYLQAFIAHVTGNMVMEDG